MKGQKVFIRDFIKKDIEDRIRWETIEIECMEWDAALELEEEKLFNPEEDILLMNKIGFVECARDKNFRIVREESYDGLTFKLDVKRHNQFIKNYSIV